MEVTVGSWVRTGPGGRGPILALDTSTDRAAVALSRGDGDCLVAPTSSSRQHGRGLLSAVRDLLQRGGVSPHELAAIGVGLGPGSFTGLRIGLTAAKTLAYAVGCPLFALDSLEAIARNAPDSARRVVAVGDAQRGDLFAAEFERDLTASALRRVAPNRLERTDDFAHELLEGTYVVGPLIGRAEPAWPSTVSRGNLTTAHPEGAVLIGMTRERMAEGRPADPWFLEPLYARPSAAEEKAGGAGLRHE